MKYETLSLQLLLGSEVLLSFLLLLLLLSLHIKKKIRSLYLPVSSSVRTDRTLDRASDSRRHRLIYLTEVDSK